MRLQVSQENKANWRKNPLAGRVPTVGTKRAAGGQELCPGNHRVRRVSQSKMWDPK